MSDKIVTISAQIPTWLDQDLTRICKREERSKSFFIKKALENFLKAKSEELTRLASENPKDTALDSFARIFSRQISDKNFNGKPENEVMALVQSEIKAVRKAKK